MVEKQMWRDHTMHHDGSQWRIQGVSGGPEAKKNSPKSSDRVII